MALTNKEKSAALRKRRSAEGLKELRGIWVHQSRETELKRVIKEWLTGDKNENKNFNK